MIGHEETRWTNFGPKTMEVIRRDAVERARAGESISTVMASYRMARTTFYKWMARMEAGDGTVRSLRARQPPERGAKAGGAAGHRGQGSAGAWF